MRNKNNQGLTLIEILIGLAMSAAIFITAASVVASLLGSTVKSKQSQTMEQVKNDLQNDIGNVAKWADNLEFIGGEFKADDTVYSLKEGRIYKDDDPLTPGDVEITKFEVTKFTAVAEATDLQNGIGLTGQYYDRRDLDDLKVTQIDFDIDFDWGDESPHVLLNPNRFSVRWSGQVETPYSGQYTFYTVSDDGVRLWIDNKLIIDNWTDHSPTENRGRINLEENKRYDMRIEYYENWGGAVMRLLWSHHEIPKEVIPTSRLYPTSSASSLEVLVEMRHKNNASLNDSLRLILSPRGGTVGAIEPAPEDLCANIDYVQTEVPHGLVREGEDCVEPPPPPPPEDQCPNLDGFQEYVPDGYKKEGDLCVEDIPVDQCLNLDGFQEYVPDGYVRDGVDCVPAPPPPPPPPPEDQCPNLPGFQDSVPDGYEKQGGNCVELPNPLR